MREVKVVGIIVVNVVGAVSVDKVIRVVVLSRMTPVITKRPASNPAPSSKAMIATTPLR